MTLTFRTYRRNNAFGLTWGRNAGERWLCLRVGGKGARFAIQRNQPEEIRTRYLIAGQW